MYCKIHRHFKNVHGLGQKKIEDEIVITKEYKERMCEKFFHVEEGKSDFLYGK